MIKQAKHKMNQKIKKLWIKALRSGKYEQGRSFLKNKYHEHKAKYCCLGVLCEVYKEQTGKAWRAPKADEFLPKSVMAWAGVETSNPELGSTTCAGANDEKQWSFKVIANMIERHL